jgi:hypothetical protein
MPVVAARREAIAAAVDAYNRAHPESPLPRPAARLLATMFPSDDVCQRSLDDLAGEGFDRKRALPATLRRLVEVGFLSRHQTSTRQPLIYRLHLPAPVPA